MHRVMQHSVEREAPRGAYSMRNGKPFTALFFRKSSLSCSETRDFSCGQYSRVVMEAYSYMNLVVSVVPSFLPALIMMDIHWNAQMLRKAIDETYVR